MLFLSLQIVSSQGNLYICDLQDSTNKFEEVCKYVLSKDREFIPTTVACSDKKDYGVIERILKENYGDKGRLTNGFLGLSGLVGMKRIKRKWVIYFISNL